MNRYVLFPFRGGALALVLTFTLGLELAIHAGYGGWLLGFMLMSWFFKYCFILLDAIVTGATEPPVLSIEMINPINEQRPLGQALLIAGGGALSYALGQLVGPALGWLTAALLLLLLPASIATLGLTGNLLRAAWPPELWSIDQGRWTRLPVAHRRDPGPGRSIRRAGALWCIVLGVDSRRTAVISTCFRTRWECSTRAPAGTRHRVPDLAGEHRGAHRA